MKIDIDRLTEAELVDLNHRIVARLRLLTQMRAHADMLEFKIGDRVAFGPPGQSRVEGMLTRYNKSDCRVRRGAPVECLTEPPQQGFVVADGAPRTVQYSASRQALNARRYALPEAVVLTRQ